MANTLLPPVAQLTGQRTFSFARDAARRRWRFGPRPHEALIPNDILAQEEENTHEVEDEEYTGDWHRTNLCLFCLTFS